MKVALGPSAKEVEIPDHLIAQFDSGKITKNGLFDYAISSGQGQARDFGLEQQELPRATGRFNAAMISAGKETTQLGSNALQLLAEIAGDQAGSEREKAKQAERERLTAPVAQEYPKSAFVGRMLPSFAVPGGIVPQVVAGAAQGALASDDPAGRLGGAALGGALAYGGTKAGDAISRAITPRVQQALGSTTGAARETLENAGVPLTLGQRGSASGRFIDVLKSTLLRRQPLQNQQLGALTRSAAEAIGEQSDDLTKPVLNRAANRIGQVFEDVAAKVGEIPIGPDEAARFTQIDDMLKTVTDPNKVEGAIQMVMEQITNPQKGGLTGASYAAGGGTLRWKLQRVASQLYSQGNGLEAEVIDELVDTLDGAFRKAAPQAVSDALDQARAQSRFLMALRRGDAVSDATGLINPVAMTKAMESKYPGFDIGRYPGGAAGQFGQTLDAFRQVVTPFKSSGTSERLAGLAAPILAGVGLTGAVGPVLGPAAMLALMLSGGGAGQQLGGGLARGLAQQAQPAVDPMSQQIAQRLRQIQ